MTSLIRTEWLKMKKYNAFWWIIGITALSYPGINYMFYYVYQELTNKPSQLSQYAKMAIGNPYTFPEAWHTVSYLSSLFVFIPAVVVIMLICNEYSFRTHRQNIIDGWSRKQFITSKMVDVLLITVLVTFLYFIIALVMGFSNQEGRLIHHTWEQSKYIGLFALQTFSQLSLAFLAGLLIRKAFLALGVFFFYYFILENILIGISQWKHLGYGDYLPLELSDRIIPRPAFISKIDLESYNESLAIVPKHILLTIIFTAIIWWICFRIYHKKDLK